MPAIPSPSFACKGGSVLSPLPLAGGAGGGPALSARRTSAGLRPPLPLARKRPPHPTSPRKRGEGRCRRFLPPPSLAREAPCFLPSRLREGPGEGPLSRRDGPLPGFARRFRWRASGPLTQPLPASGERGDAGDSFPLLRLQGRLRAFSPPACGLPDAHISRSACFAGKEFSLCGFCDSLPLTEFGR